MTKRFNEIIFFILLAVVFMIFFEATKYFYIAVTSSFSKGVILVTSSVIFSLCFLGYTQLTKLFGNEGFNYCPSPSAKLCRGGPYMWQGDSGRAKFCRDLYSTPEGKAEINRFECGAGFTGMPGRDFEFTPISDQHWRNKRCDSPSGCDIDDNGIF